MTAVMASESGGRKPAGPGFRKKELQSHAIGANGTGTDPASRWSASASSRPRPAARGRAGGCQRSRSGRLPLAARMATSTPGAMSGRTASATPVRLVSTCSHRLACSHVRGRLNSGSRIWPETYLSGADPWIKIPRLPGWCAAGLGSSIRTTREAPAALGTTRRARTTSSVFVWCVRPPSRIAEPREAPRERHPKGLSQGRSAKREKKEPCSAFVASRWLWPRGRHRALRRRHPVPRNASAWRRFVLRGARRRMRALPPSQLNISFGSARCSPD